MPRGSGRRPLPTAVKKLRGNPGHRALNPKEPKPKAEPPEMPLSLSEAAAAEWKAIVPELAQLGVLSKIDGKALAAYCHCYARWIEAEKELDRGLVLEEPIIDKEGDVVGYKFKRNPAVSISNEALKLMKAYLVEFGMTPAARSRIRIEKPAEADPFEQYLAGKKTAPGAKQHVN